MQRKRPSECRMHTSGIRCRKCISSSFGLERWRSFSVHLCLLLACSLHRLDRSDWSPTRILHISSLLLLRTYAWSPPDVGGRVWRGCCLGWGSAGRASGPGEATIVGGQPHKALILYSLVIQTKPCAQVTILLTVDDRRIAQDEDEEETVAVPGMLLR